MPKDPKVEKRPVGVSNKLWEIGDIVALVEAEEAKVDRKRGSYQKKETPAS